ncbi:hypothetical protein [Rheinheimera sp.]
MDVASVKRSGRFCVFASTGLLQSKRRSDGMMPDCRHHEIPSSPIKPA